jgi:pimeloyl-[acyl-carrier protein] synthase
MRRALVSALDEAGRSGRDAAQVDDLLTVIVRDRESAGAYVLEQCGVPADRAIPADAAILPAGSPKSRALRLDPSAMRILQAAALEATRLNHDHIGTEHIIAALAKATDLETGKRLFDAGLTPAHAEAAMRRWLAEGMPRRREGFAWRSLRSPILRTIVHPIQKAARFPVALWKIYTQKSLGHPGFVNNPYPLYSWLRERQPVRKDPLAPVWVLTRYDDVVAMLRDPRFKKDPFEAERLPRLVRKQLGVAAEESRVDQEAISMLFLDPPAHTRVRGVFSRAFTPASLAELKPRIELITRKRLDRVETSGRMDIIADLAYPLPVIVIAELLGFPPEDFEKIKKWSDDFAASLALNATTEAHQIAAKSRVEIREYFDAVVFGLHTRPRDTLLQRLLASERDPAGLNREEIFSNCVLLLSAGHETTTNLIGNGVLALMRNREQWDSLVRDPSLLEAAVEELLRFDCPVQWTSRVAGEAIEMGGQTIPAGDIILGCVGAANRDPEKFPDPDRFDVRRVNNKHLSFGTGIHYCLGAALARMEFQIALGGLINRFPNMRLATKKLKWLKGLTFRGVKQLPVILK